MGEKMEMNPVGSRRTANTRTCCGPRGYMLVVWRRAEINSPKNEELPAGLEEETTKRQLQRVSTSPDVATMSPSWIQGERSTYLEERRGWGGRALPTRETRLDEPQRCGETRRDEKRRRSQANYARASRPQRTPVAG